MAEENIFIFYEKYSLNFPPEMLRPRNNYKLQSKIIQNLSSRQRLATSSLMNISNLLRNYNI